MRLVDPIWRDRLATLINTMGFEWIGGEWVSQGKQPILRLYIDTATGVTADDCARVSRQVSAMLDVEDRLPAGRYHLEVSSPGVNRPLFELVHYQKYVGSRVIIRLHVPMNQHRQYRGRLLCIEGEAIHLLPDDQEEEVILPFSAIKRANLFVV
jgi:ribosome maturation factor RimP